MSRVIPAIAVCFGLMLVWQNGYSQKQAEPCLSGFIDFLYPNPSSIQELTSRADVVVMAEVQNVFPAMPPVARGAGPLFTDALMKTTQVFKGTNSIDRFVIRQLGGTQGQNKLCNAEYKLVEQGETYMMFLKPTSSSRAAKLDDRGAPRYDLVQDFYGAVRIENGMMIWAPGMSAAWHSQYDRMQYSELASLLLSLTPKSLPEGR